MPNLLAVIIYFYPYMDFTFQIHLPAFRFTTEYLEEHELDSRCIACPGGTVIQLAADNTIGWEEMEAALLQTPGVDPALVHKRWVGVHYRWVLDMICS